MLHKESVQFIWDSPEFEYKEKDKRWYWYVGITAALLIILSIFLKNYLFGFLILIGGFLMFSLSTKRPTILPVEVSQHGIKIHDVMYAYENIFSFWMTQNKNKEAVLLVTTNKSITPTISVIVEPHINIMQLREFLSEFTEEQEIREPLTDKIINHIGF